MTLETSLANETLFVAQTQMDVREEKNNSGPEVLRYQKSVSLGAGAPWCMAFVYWCVRMAAQRLTIENPLVKTGHVLTQWNQCTLKKIPSRDKSVKPGDIFIMDFGNGTGHTGFVESVNGSIVNTIEGNTNDEGSREGYEVARRQRSITEIKGFIQL